MATTKKVLNLNTAVRGQDVNYVELIPVAELGPLGQAESTTTPPSVNAVVWSIVPAMTQDLKNAIIAFIDQDKTGNSFLSNIFDGRTKTIEFEFQGLPSNIYQFGNIGLITINMSYPPGAAIVNTPITQVFGNTITSSLGG